MKKTTIFIVSLLLTLFLILVSCKTEEDILKEKNECYEKCMDETDDETFCLEDCRLEEGDLEEEAVCGDGVCQDEEKQTSPCPEDCLPKCSSDSDCQEKYRCDNSICTSVDCTADSHCSTGFGCEEYVCVEQETINATEVQNLERELTALENRIDGILDRIDGLQDLLDAADASDEDKEDIQADIDALDDVSTTLESYKETVGGYSTDLEEATTAADVATVEAALVAAQEEIDAYLEEQSTAMDDIEEAIATLTPIEQSDLVVEDFDLESVSGNDGTFTITFKNDDDGDITENETFRIKLTSFDLDNETEVDDSKIMFGNDLEADAEDEVELEVEMAYDIEQYFEDNNDADNLKLLFLVELDIDDSIDESDETNNEKYYNITFDREDYFTNTAPTAVIVANTTAVYVGESIFFNGTGSTDSDGSMSSYSWNFGDGDSSSNAERLHSYITAGSYTVTLTVTDDNSATDTETVTIEVTEPLLI